MPHHAKRTIASLLTLTLALPAPAWTAEPTAPPPQAERKVVCHDVALTKDGRLQGQVLNSQGQPVLQGKVWIAGAKGKPVAATTDQHGRFAFKNVPLGAYCLQSGDAVRACRVWRHDAAPPKSVGALLMVADEQAVRAQSSPPPMLAGFVKNSKKFFAHPVGMLTLGAAIATPIALAATDDDDPPASP